MAKLLERWPDDSRVQTLAARVLGLKLDPGFLTVIDPDWSVVSSLQKVTGLSAAGLLELLYQAGPHVSVPVVRLRQKLRVRPATSDVLVLVETFDHHPEATPEEVGEPRIVVDLGANIGATLAKIAVASPSARIVGVELDPENASLARENTSAWADRVTVVEAAVAARPGAVRYKRQGLEPWTYAVGEEGEQETGAVTLDYLLAEYGLASVDFLNIDVEGAERELLRAGGSWAGRTRCVSVEVHGDYRPAEAESDLRGLGFDVRLDHFNELTLVGWRDSWRPSAVC